MSKINLHNYEAFILDYYEGHLSAEDLKDLFAFLKNHPQLQVDLTDDYLPSLDIEEEKIEFKQSLKRELTVSDDELILDYLEGNMDAHSLPSFIEKINATKELKKSLQLFQCTVSLPNQEISYSDKNKLIKSDDDLVVNNRFVAYLENDLSKEEKQQFELDLEKESTMQTEWSLYRSAVLIADKSLVYEDKQALKKETKVIFLFRQKTARALVAAVLLIVASVYVFTNFFNVEDTKLDIAQQSKKAMLPENKKEVPAIIKNLEVSPDQDKNEILASEITSHRVRPSSTNNNTLDEQNEVASNSELTTNSSNSSDFKKSEDNPMTPEVKLTQVLSEETKKEISLAIESELVHYSSIDEITEASEENSEEEVPVKLRFWKKAVHLAQQANQLGLKALNGKEKEKDQYLLSFNSFSIEKK